MTGESGGGEQKKLLASKTSYIELEGMGCWTSPSAKNWLLTVAKLGAPIGNASEFPIERIPTSGSARWRGTTCLSCVTPASQTPRPTLSTVRSSLLLRNLRPDVSLPTSSTPKALTGESALAAWSIGNLWTSWGRRYALGILASWLGPRDSIFLELWMLVEVAATGTLWEVVKRTPLAESLDEVVRKRARMAMHVPPVAIARTRGCFHNLWIIGAVRLFWWWIGTYSVDDMLTLWTKLRFRLWFLEDR